MECWEKLPESVRAGIVAMVKESGPAVDEDTPRAASRPGSDLKREHKK
jgi:hypothetical protein